MTETSHSPSDTTNARSCEVGSSLCVGNNSSPEAPPSVLSESRDASSSTKRLFFSFLFLVGGGLEDLFSGFSLRRAARSIPTSILKSSPQSSSSTSLNRFKRLNCGDVAILEDSREMKDAERVLFSRADCGGSHKANSCTAPLLIGVSARINGVDVRNGGDGADVGL